MNYLHNYQFDTQNDILLYDQYVDYYFVDHVHQNILLRNQDGDAILLNSQGQEIDNPYQWTGFDRRSFFWDGYLYYQDYQEAHVVGQEGEVQFFEMEDCLQFGMCGDMIYYRDFDDVLYSMQENQKSHIIYEDVYEFFVVGDKVVFCYYNEDSSYYYFIAGNDSFALLD